MQLAKASAAANWAFVGLRGPGPPPGRSLPHFFCAAWKAGDCGFNPEPGLIWIPPPAPGSGKFGTPLARMHAENFSAWSDAAFAEVPVPPDCADPPPHAATQSTVTRARAIRIWRGAPAEGSDRRL